MSTGRIVRLGAVAGIAGGVAMAMVAMLAGWTSADHTAWHAPRGIATWVLGYEGDERAALLEGAVPIVAGLLLHMLNSVVVGVLFALAAGALGLRGASVIAGAVFWALLVWVVMRLVVLQLNTPEGTMFREAIVLPQWAWWVGHLAYGMGLGLVYETLRERMPAVRTAG